MSSRQNGPGRSRLPVGAVSVRDVSRRFKIVHERNLTLKEAVIRRGRVKATDSWALRGVSLDIQPGEAVGIIGKNGSGKSTLLKLMAGILPPTSGTIESGGRVASLLELGSGFHPDFTGRENVYMNGSIYGLSKTDVDERIDDIVRFAEIGEYIDMPVRTYSSGMFMRLAFSVASYVQPDVLLLDEVLAVGDEAFQRKCHGRMGSYLRGGGTLVLVSHDAGAIERVCTRVVLLSDGKVSFDGDPMEGLRRYRRFLADTPDREAHVDPTSDDAEEWGNHKVRIVDARLVGPDGVTTTLLSGDAMEIVFDVEAKEPIRSPVFGMGIFDVEERNLYSTNSRLDGTGMGDIFGRTTVRFSIPDLTLHEGRFILHLSAVSSDLEEVYHWIQRVLEFTVFQQGPGVGPVRLSGAWSIESASAEDSSLARAEPKG